MTYSLDVAVFKAFMTHKQFFFCNCLGLTAVFTLCQLFLCVQGYKFRLQHDASNEIDVNWHDSVQSSKEPVWLILQRRVYVSLQCAA